jgi:type I site-specific restriction endonuclease
MKPKQECSEKELEDLYIEPALVNAGWNKKKKHPNEAIEETLESPDVILNRMQKHFEILSGLMAELRL